MVKKTKYSKEDNIYTEVKQSVQEIKKIWTTIRRFDRLISRLAILEYQFERVFGTAGIEATAGGIKLSKLPKMPRAGKDITDKILKEMKLFNLVTVLRGDIKYEMIDNVVKHREELNKLYLEQRKILWRERVNIDKTSKEMAFRGGLLKLGRISIIMSLFFQFFNIAIALWEQKIKLDMERKRQSDWFKTKQEISKQVRDQAKDSQSKFRSVIP